jgi:chromosomal replication initiation ATPase DnaA
MQIINQLLNNNYSKPHKMNRHLRLSNTKLLMMRTEFKACLIEIEAELHKRGVIEVEQIYTPIKMYSITAIFEAVKKVTEQDPSLPTRRREVAEAKHIFRYLACKHTTMSLNNIASIGGFDHTTIIHSTTTCSNLLQTNDVFKEKFEAVVNCLDN